MSAKNRFGSFAQLVYRCLAPPFDKWSKLSIKNGLAKLLVTTQERFCILNIGQVFPLHYNFDVILPTDTILSNLPFCYFKERPMSEWQINIKTSELIFYLDGKPICIPAIILDQNNSEERKKLRIEATIFAKTKITDVPKFVLDFLWVTSNGGELTFIDIDNVRMKVYSFNKDRVEFGMHRIGFLHDNAYLASLRTKDLRDLFAKCQGKKVSFVLFLEGIGLEIKNELIGIYDLPTNQEESYLQKDKALETKCLFQIDNTNKVFLQNKSPLTVTYENDLWVLKNTNDEAIFGLGEGKKQQFSIDPYYLLLLVQDFSECSVIIEKSDRDILLRQRNRYIAVPVA